jgi:hypothetical protein
LSRRRVRVRVPSEARNKMGSTYCGEMMTDKRQYEGKHRDPEGRSESHFKKSEPEILGIPLSKKVRAKKDAGPKKSTN